MASGRDFNSVSQSKSHISSLLLCPLPIFPFFTAHKPEMKFSSYSNDIALSFSIVGYHTIKFPFKLCGTFMKCGSIGPIVNTIYLSNRHTKNHQFKSLIGEDDMGRDL